MGYLPSHSIAVQSDSESLYRFAREMLKLMRDY
jgi:hypothetical protein